MTARAEPQKTRRLYLLLRDAIVSGELSAGSRLPSEPALAEQHKVSRVTLRKVLEQLAQEKLIIRKAGAGTFVASRSIEQPMVADLSDLLSQLVNMGSSTQVKLLSFGYGPAPAQVANALNLPDGAIVQSSIRVRHVDEAPFSYLTVYVPEKLGRQYSRSDLAQTPLITLLERSGIVLSRASQVVRAALAGPEVAEALEVEIGSPLLSIVRTISDENGTGIEYLHGLYRPDRYAFQLDLVRTGNAGNRHWSPRNATRDNG